MPGCLVTPQAANTTWVISSITRGAQPTRLLGFHCTVRSRRGPLSPDRASPPNKEAARSHGHEQGRQRQGSPPLSESISQLSCLFDAGIPAHMHRSSIDLVGGLEASLGLTSTEGD